MVYGRKHASKQANIHTHMCNAVPLVWGLLRLAPINVEKSTSPSFRHQSPGFRHQLPIFFSVIWNSPDLLVTKLEGLNMVCVLV